jgi:hypothetical protein
VAGVAAALGASESSLISLSPPPPPIFPRLFVLLLLQYTVKSLALSHNNHFTSMSSLSALPHAERGLVCSRTRPSAGQTPQTHPTLAAHLLSHSHGLRALDLDPLAATGGHAWKKRFACPPAVPSTLTSSSSSSSALAHLCTPLCQRLILPSLFTSSSSTQLATHWQSTSPPRTRRPSRRPISARRRGSLPLSSRSLTTSSNPPSVNRGPPATCAENAPSRWLNSYQRYVLPLPL